MKRSINEISDIIGRNQWECNGITLIFYGQFQGRAVTGFRQFFFAVTTALCIAPSTLPPLNRVTLAAFTMASHFIFVISFLIIFIGIAETPVWWGLEFDFMRANGISQPLLHPPLQKHPHKTCIQILLRQPALLRQSSAP